MVKNSLTKNKISTPSKDPRSDGFGYYAQSKPPIYDKINGHEGAYGTSILGLR